jgi:hemerythrin-like metal-binding protein
MPLRNLRAVRGNTREWPCLATGSKALAVDTYRIRVRAVVGFSLAPQRTAFAGISSVDAWTCSSSAGQSASHGGRKDRTVTEGAMYIRWEPALALHNDLLDTQHRILVMLCRKLDIAIKTKVAEETMLRIILELRKFAEFHFVSEENLMSEIGYPGRQQHVATHTGLLAELDAALPKIAQGTEFPDDMLYFFNKWLTQHVLQDDRLIADFARTSRKRPLGEGLYKEYLLT